MGPFTKTLSTLIAFALLIICLVSCGGKTSKSELSRWIEPNGKVKVLATTSIVQDMVSNVGGEHVDVIALVTGDLNPHSYELVKGDSEKFLHASIIFANGLLLEHSPSVQYQLQSHPNVLFIGDEIHKKNPSKIIYVGKEIDPHIWMDLSLWTEGVDFVVERLSIQDPLHAEDYKKNGEIRKAEFLKTDLHIKKEMGNIPLEKRYLVTSHDAFNYFVRRYLAPQEENNGAWKSRLEALQGLAPDDQISALSIQNIVDYVSEHDVKVIFPEANLSQDALQKVKEACKSRGTIIQIPKESLFGDTLGEENSHIDMLEHNARILDNYLGEHGR